MPKKQKRNNVYYEQQLKTRYPAVHSDFLAGKYRSLREALFAAGIKQPRTREQELKNAWQKATAHEQREFLRWLKSKGTSPLTSSPAIASSSAPIAVDRQLEAWAAKRIGDVMSRRGMRIGEVMVEMGFSRLDASLGMALHRGSRLRADVIVALEKWLSANKRI